MLLLPYGNRYLIITKQSTPKQRTGLIGNIINHYNDVIMSAVASQITSISILCSTVGSGADQRKHHSSASFVRGIHRWPVNSPHKWPLTWKMFPFDDVMQWVWFLSLRRVISPCTPLFVQNITQANDKGTNKGLYCWPMYHCIKRKYSKLNVH